MHEQDEYASRAHNTLEEIAGALQFTGGYPLTTEATEAAGVVRDAAARIRELEEDRDRLAAIVERLLHLRDTCIPDSSEYHGILDDIEAAEVAAKGGE